MKRREFLKRSLMLAGGLTLGQALRLDALGLPAGTPATTLTSGGGASPTPAPTPTQTPSPAATAAATHSAAPTPATSGLPHSLLFKKSMMWGCIDVEGSVLDKCRAVKAAGFNGVEHDSGMDRSEMLAALKETGLQASSVCCSTHWEFPLSHPDAATRRKGIDGAIRALEDAKAYGTDAILLVPGVVNAETSYSDCWKRSAESLKEIIPAAKDMKVRIGIENVWNNFLLSPMEAARYVDQFDSSWLGFYFDIGNIVMYGWPEQWIAELGGERLVRIHIKEFSRDLADAEGRWKGFSAPLGEGSVDWPAVMKAIRISGYDSPWLTIEIPGTLSDLSRRWDRVTL